MDRTFSIGSWRINPELGEISGSGETVRVEPKVMDLLLCLCARPGEVVSKEALIENAWPDTHVAEAALTSAIWKLRQAFGDDPKNPTVIQTVPRRGYRLLPPVSRSVPPVGAVAPLGAGPEVRRERRLPHWLSALILLSLGLLAGILIGFEFGSRTVPASSDSQIIGSVALLPLEVRSDNRQLAVLGDGIVHGASIRLSQLDRIKVVSGAPTQRYADSPVDATRVSRDLGVRGVLTGFVADVGDEVVVYIELLDGADNSNLWGKRFRRRRSDVLRIEEEFSIDIATALGLRLSREEASSITRRYTDNLNAYNLFQLARFQCRYEEKTVRECIELYLRAIELDPAYALPYAAIAHLYYGTDAERPEVAMPLAERYARQALQLEPDLAQAHEVLALIRLYYHWDWEGAREGLDRALELRPNAASTYKGYAALLTQLGRTDEALAKLQTAAELDPLEPALKAQQGQILTLGRRYEEAVAVLEAALSESAECLECRANLAKGLLLNGRGARSVEIFQELLDSGATHLSLTSAAGYAYGRTGDSERAEALMNDLLKTRADRYVPASWIATILVGLGRYDQALDWLEAARSDRDAYLVFLRVSPTWDPLRGRSRFRQLLEQVGFGPARSAHPVTGTRDSGVQESGVSNQ